MCPQRSQESISCLSSEELSPLVSSLDVICWSTVECRCHYLISWLEGITEISVQQTTITIPVIPSHEQEYIIFVREASKIIESFYKLRCSYPAFAEFVYHLEGIHEVEVRLLSKSSPGFLELLLHSQLFS